MICSLTTASGTTSVPGKHEEDEPVKQTSIDEEKQATLDMIAAQRKKVEKRKRKAEKAKKEEK